MRLSDFDTPVQFMRLQAEDDGFSENGAPVDHGGKLLAKKEDLSDGERWRAGEIAAVVTTRFTLRATNFTRGLTPNDQLRCRGVVYQLFGVKVSRVSKDFLEFSAGTRTDQ